MRAAMIEALLVLASVAGLALLGLVAPLVSGAWLVEAGWVCTAVGLLVGAPTGFWYHVKLRSTLRVSGRPPERWWLHPVAHHDRLPPEARPSVMLWFRLGGLGFAVAVLGCALVGGGVVLEGLRAGVF